MNLAQRCSCIIISHFIVDVVVDTSNFCLIIILPYFIITLLYLRTLVTLGVPFYLGTLICLRIISREAEDYVEVSSRLCLLDCIL